MRTSGPVKHAIDPHSSPTRCEGCGALWPCQGYLDQERAHLRASAARTEAVYGPEPAHVVPQAKKAA